MSSSRIPGSRLSGTAAGAVLAAAALLASGVSAGSAGAAPADAGDGARIVSLSSSQRAELLRDAESALTRTTQALGLGAKEKLLVRDVVKDADGSLHTRYERTYDGLPVLGGDLIVHQDAKGAHQGVTKAVRSALRVATTEPAISAAAAEKSAVSTALKTGVDKAAEGKEPRKVVWAAKGKPVLAWETVTGGFQEDGTPSELHVVTDAATGERLHTYQAVHNGAGESQYSGSVELGTSGAEGAFTLTDTARGGHTTSDLEGGESGEGTLFTDADDTWGDGSANDRQTAGVDAHYGAATTWDYFKDVLGREGIRGDGVGATSRVHFGDNYVNAFWQDSCFCMTYGDGEGNAKPLTSLDVAAHEMTHGVTSATAGLEYSGESGGLNEATSDILAAAVEFHADNAEDKGDYLVGERLDINGDGSPLRHMDQPSKDGNSEDYWSEGLGDIDVHYSSGPANHFFYLLAEGSGQKEINGVSYDSPTSDGSTVEGIGIEAAAQIWYKALTTYMTSTTDYHGAREATLKAAADLYGEGSAEHRGVDAAWAGVNVK
ncbi:MULTISPECIES: M4 family metallopeptidase [Streptomyces]|uniref:M4 family metallopeptidase n=1 Tax=Streptomyces sp. Ru87 TaxID=2044307 RepID=UPI001F31922C|nr:MULTISPECIES: M4 family metallopeptidase [Streptomyces]